MQVVCCLWLGHFITSMYFTCHKIKFLVPSKFFLVKSFAFPLKLLTCFECRVPCVWLHYPVRHREGRSRDIMGQQIGQPVCRFVNACSWLLWKQWRSRSSWSAEEMRRDISLGVPPAQAPLALPVLGCPASPGLSHQSWQGQASSEGCFEDLVCSCLATFCYHCSPWASCSSLLHFSMCWFWQEQQWCW